MADLVPSPPVPCEATRIAPVAAELGLPQRNESATLNTVTVPVKPPASGCEGLVIVSWVEGSAPASGAPEVTVIFRLSQVPPSHEITGTVVLRNLLGELGSLGVSLRLPE